MSREPSSEEKTDLQWVEDVLFVALGLGLQVLGAIGKVARTVATYDYRRGNLPKEGDPHAST